MAKLGFVLSVLALAAAGWLFHENADLRAELRQQQDAIAALPAARAVARDGVTGGYEKPMPAPTEAAPVASPRGEGGASPALAARGEAARTIEERLARLEGESVAAKKAVAALEEKARASPHPVPFDEAGFLNTFFPDLETAARVLQLDERQKAGMERVRDDAKRELDDLYAIRNDDGTTWTEAAKVKFEGSGENGMIAFATNLAKLEKFKKTRIPGSRETFGEADKRIRGRAKEQMRSFLTPDQGKSWDKANTDSILGHGGGGDISLAFSTVEIVDGDGPAPK
jgi:hypothetical protein